jgi:endonuclease G
MVKYSETLEQPLYVYYVVKCNNGTISRSGMDFRLHEGVKTSDNEDYKNNIWDKGHLAPAASFNCDEDYIRMTFDYINCSLQHQSLNRGAWKDLERFERDIAKFYDSVEVEIKCHFSRNSLVLPSGATVPDGYTKTIRWDDKEECFYFPNDDTNGKKWFDFYID